MAVNSYREVFYMLGRPSHVKKRMSNARAQKYENFGIPYLGRNKVSLRNIFHLFFFEIMLTNIFQLPGLQPNTNRRRIHSQAKRAAPGFGECR